MLANVESLKPLLTTLLDLSRALEECDVPLTVAGGLGLYLKQMQIQQAGTRTLLDEFPRPARPMTLTCSFARKCLCGLRPCRALRPA